jgi:putative multicomponent Na+:H+ antiporter subunit B
MNDIYMLVIIALLPLSACMLIFQVNPYHALVIRGILGAVAALVYAVLGAADVALTEALVGTMLAITLYAVAVRSSLTMRLGVLEDGAVKAEDDSLGDGKAVSVAAPQEYHHFGQLMDDLRAIFSKHHMRIELVPYTDKQALQRALMEKEVHATCTRPERSQQGDRIADESEAESYHTETRVQRLYEIMQAELSSPATSLTYVSAPDAEEKH